MKPRSGWRPYLLDGDLGHQLDAYLAGRTGQYILPWSPKDRARADRILYGLVERVAQDILDREGLPHLAHLICGWGNALVNGRPLFDRIFDFADYSAGAARILQNNPNGDFHPWQSFAYCTMSDPRGLLFTAQELSIEALARNSLDLNTSDETDLGHFLYTAGRMRSKAQPRAVVFAKTQIELSRLVPIAIEGHYYGGFEVCRKFHLTEGLCSISRVPDGLGAIPVIRELLDGQLDSLRPLAAIVCLIGDHIESDIGDMPHSEASLLKGLRRLLVLGEAVENLFYYAGHLIELAAIAIESRHEPDKNLLNLIPVIVVGLDKILSHIQEDLAFAESFYAFAHYRRGIELFSKVVSLDSGTNIIERIVSPPHEEIENTRARVSNRPFVFAPPKTAPRNRFRAVLEDYNGSVQPHQRARGEFAHFRKIMLRELPVGVHFEFLDYGALIGVEIHCERETLKDHLLFERITDSLRERVSAGAVFDPNWYSGCGRVVVSCADNLQPEMVALTMRESIAVALPALSEYFNASPAPT